MANKCHGGRGWSLAVLLCGAGGVASFCFGGGRPSGLETFGVSTSFRCGVGDYSGNYFHGAAAHYGGSDPSGVGLQGRPSLCTPGLGWDDGHLERPRSLGSFTYFEYYKWIYGKLYNREFWREEGEVQQHLGAGGRHGVHAGREVGEGHLLHPVCAGDGGFASGSGGSNTGATGCNDQEGEGNETTALCGFRGVAALRQETPESSEIQVLCDAGRRVLCLEVSTGPGVLPTLATELQGVEDNAGHDGPGGVGKSDAMGEQDRGAEQSLRELLAPDSGGRRQRKRRTDGKDVLKNQDEHRRRGGTAQGMGCEQTLGGDLEACLERSGLLARTSSSTGNGVDGKRWSRSGPGTGRRDHPRKGQREKGRELELRNGDRGRQEARQQGSQGSEEEEVGSRKRRVESLQRGQREIWKRWRRKGWWQGPWWVWEPIRRRMLRVEQWKWFMRGLAGRITMQRKSSKTSPVHGVQVTGTPIQGMPTEEGLNLLMLWWLMSTGRRKTAAGGNEEDLLAEPPEVRSTRKGTKRKRFCGDDPPDKREAPQDKIHVEGEYLDFEGYCGARPFIFVHHFSGKEDRLSQAVKEEGAKRGLTVNTYSADIARGNDLGEEQPFKSHHHGAFMADVDGYHSGFPCNTYTKLRWRPLAGHPGPLRSKEEPYGLSTLSKAQKVECDKGTIYMARSVDMVKAMEEGYKDMVVKGFSTLENPPPSDHPKHISAWHMPELYQLVNRLPHWESAHFNTCAYEEDLAVGSRHYKPQLVGGTLPGIGELRRDCGCGGAPHEPIVGKEKSSRAAAYPESFCKAYGKLAATHFLRMARSEFLEGRRELLRGSIEKRKRAIQRIEESKERHEMGTADIETRFPKEMAVGLDRMRQLRGEFVAKPKRETEVEEDESKSANKAQEAMHWKGGGGNYGMVREQAKGAAGFRAVGGMRDPHLSVRALPTVQALGKRTWELWEEFVKEDRRALCVAESYGTEDCRFDEEAVQAWKDKLYEMWNVQKVKQGVALKANDIYYTPVDWEMLRVWQKRSGDPEKWVPHWLEVGAPLGIERSIQTAGIFPAMDAEEDKYQAEWDSDLLLEKGDMRNYKSVEEARDDAEIELNRYKERKFCVAIKRREALERYEGGTVSRMGLILKAKESGEIKRRLVLDMRRSGGNSKSRLPERLTLPRPRDVIQLLRHMHEVPREPSCDTEFALVDVADAFTTLPVAPAEWKHAMAPSLQEDEVLIFQALLFGYKVAPLLYSRFAAMLARLLQSSMVDTEAAHEVYLDDSLWCLRGNLTKRTSMLAFVLNTMKALGVPVAVSKGARATKITWIGVTFAVEEQDTLVMGIPIKFATEMKEILESWENRGYAPIKELRTIAGKASWLGGILPRTRWLTSVFYAVLVDSTNEEKKEGSQAMGSSSDQRPRKGLFPVRRLELARRWTIKFLEAAMERPIRRIPLIQREEADIRLMTDASPEGLGGVLSINGRILKAFSSPVEPADQEQLGFTMGASSSQAILEALAILVGIRHFESYLKAKKKVSFTVQADSIAALALTQKLAAGAASPALNFIGAELGITLEKMAIQEVIPLHIPGKMNVEPDFLSRPSLWKDTAMPTGLHGIEIDPVSGRTAEFYQLPSPMAEPSLWGVKGCAAGISGVWDTLQKGV